MLSHSYLEKNSMKGPRWTAEEEKVLTDQITRNANNLRRAFRETARILGDRGWIACKQHWYYISKKPKISPLFATIGYKTRNVNRKNVHAKTSDNTERTTVRWWRKILNFLKG